MGKIQNLQELGIVFQSLVLFDQKYSEKGKLNYNENSSCWVNL